MKHRIVGDHNQVIAFELEQPDELLVFNGVMIFTRGNADLREGERNFPETGLPAAGLLVSPEGSGIAGIKPAREGHLKRFDIGPPAASIVDVRSVFALTKGISVRAYKPEPDIALKFGERKYVVLSGAGAAFLRTKENFLEFTLGEGESLKAYIEHVVSFSENLQIKPEAASRGRGWFIFDGPGKLILSTA